MQRGPAALPAPLLGPTQCGLPPTLAEPSGHSRPLLQYEAVVFLQPELDDPRKDPGQLIILVGLAVLEGKPHRPILAVSAPPDTL